MATLTVQTVGRAGLSLATADVPAAAGGDKFANTGTEKEFLYAKNGSGSSITITFAYVSTADGQLITARTVVVGAGDAALIGPFPSQYFNDASGFVNFTYSDVTTLTVAAIKIGN